MEADQAPGVGEGLRLRRKTACQVAQINPRRRRVLLQRKAWASSLAPPRTTAASASGSFLTALERTTARAHYALNSVRIPHDGTSHAPPSSSTGHGDS